MRRAAVGLLLLLLPVVLVNAVRQTGSAPVLSASPSRQLGDPKAKVTIVEYSDFQCPSCAHMQPTVHQFLDMYKGKVRVIYKYYPLTKIHKNAMSAAQAAQCASRQNQFWPYADKLFSTQAQWELMTDPTTNYMAIAQDVKLNQDRFSACLKDPAEQEPILRDSAEARARDVNATPTFFVEDERLVGGVFASDGARVIEKELRK